MKSKNNLLKNILTVLISLAFAAFFLWIALKGLDLDTIKTSISNANFLWVGFAAVFGLLAYWFRAIRWNLLLEPLGHKVSNSNALWSISFGYLMNLTIPRSGEVARATALYGVEKTPVNQSFGTIILERVIDLICMAFFLLITLLFKYDVILSFYKIATATASESTQKAEHNGFEKFLISIGIINLDSFYFSLKIFVLILFIALFLYLIIYKRDKLVNFCKGLLNGLTSVFKLKQKWKFIIYTIAIWLSYFFAAYLICFSLPETSNFSIFDGCYILVVGTLGMIVPASGGIGAFNLAMKYGFMALFISVGKDATTGGEVGLIYSFISLPLQIFLMLVMGLISIPMLARARKV